MGTLSVVIAMLSRLSYYHSGSSFNITSPSFPAPLRLIFVSIIADRCIPVNTIPAKKSCYLV
jgi:hypothetical protein